MKRLFTILTIIVSLTIFVFTAQDIETHAAGGRNGMGDYLSSAELFR